MNIIDIIKNIAKKLKISETILLDIIKPKITDKELNENIIDTEIINKLLNIDSQFVTFEDKYIIKEKTKNNFNELKNNLGKLQILVLINKLKKSENCDDILNSFLSVFNNKFKTINNILISELNQLDSHQLGESQLGGGNFIYYKKYIKYKIKYLQLLI
jgi:hypothetical protein